MRALLLAKIDFARLIGSKRWFVVVAIWSAITVLARAQIAARGEMTGLAGNIWDLRFIAVNNWMYVSYLLLIGFVFLVGDTVITDRAEGWSAASITRSGGVWAWWTGKVTFVVLAAAAYQLGFLAFTVAFAAMTGLPVAAGASPLSLAPLTPGALFAPLASASALPGRLALSLAHETLGFSAVTLLLLALCARAKRASATVATAVVFVITDWVFAQRVTLWELLSPGRRLLESVHVPVAGVPGGSSWTSTLLYLALILVVAVVAGGVSTRGLEF